MPSLSERLIQYFYLWESRGRGWQYWDIPVQLEPPFEPFNPSSAMPIDEGDDGRHPTFLHFLYRKLVPRRRKDPLINLALPSPKPLRQMDLAVFSLSLPRSFSLDGYEAQQLLLMLSYCAHPVSFEIIGTEGSISIQMVCAEIEAIHVESQVRIYYPTCTIIRSDDVLAQWKDLQIEVIEFGLDQEFMRPIAHYNPNEPSMHMGLKGVLDGLQHGESCCLQVLFQGTRQPWTQSILRSVSDGRGHSFFEDAPEMPKLAAKKTASHLFAVVVRVASSAASMERTVALTKNMGLAVVRQSASASNSLVRLSNDGYDPSVHFEDFKARQSRHNGMLLNIAELAIFVHVPDDAILARALSLVHSKTKALPSELKGYRHILGLNVHQGMSVPATVSDEQRYTHAHVIGATGTGKSTYLLYSIVQDIANGNGVAVIDPHGDLIEAILNFIPENRLKDVIIVDPSDSEYSVGFNILKANSELEREVLSSDLVSIFQKLSTSWGDQMTSVLANALIAFLESKDGGTLVDVRRFLLEPSFRDSVLKTVSDDSVKYYWQHEFPLIKTNSIGSILTRLDTFLRPKAIRHMVAQKEGLNFDDILNNQRILLVKLSHGMIGESNSYLLGSLFLSKIYQTALSRQGAKTSERKGFFVYVDEFQHYLVPSLSHLLSGARKYSIGLTLAHQSLEQISSNNSELASSLISNAGIRVCFRLGEGDAQKMEKGFASFDASDLMNLGTGGALCRVGRSDIDFNVLIPKDPVSSSRRLARRDEIIEDSRKKYGKLRSNLKISRDVISLKESISDTHNERLVIDKPDSDGTYVSEKTNVLNVATKIIADPDLVRSIVKRKEESKHKYLQLLIKRNAESRGFKAMIECPTRDGKGRIDLVLEKGKAIYAIEIGITTTKDWEVHNIAKCLSDGYANVIALSEDRKGVELMTQKLMQCNLLPDNCDSLKVQDISEFMGMLDRSEPREDINKVIKGYRIKVNYNEKKP